MLTSLIFIFTLNFSIFADDSFVYCSLKNQENQSELRITMDEFEPIELALRSPNENEYRVQSMNITNVIGTYQTDTHAFFAKPNITSEMIDWSQTNSCFVEVGTQWYFNFDYSNATYHVQLSPNFIKREESCITPRFPLQTKELSCN